MTDCQTEQHLWERWITSTSDNDRLKTHFRNVICKGGNGTFTRKNTTQNTYHRQIAWIQTKHYFEVVQSLPDFELVKRVSTASQRVKKPTADFLRALYSYKTLVVPSPLFRRSLGTLKCAGCQVDVCCCCCFFIILFLTVVCPLIFSAIHLHLKPFF